MLDKARVEAFRQAEAEEQAVREVCQLVDVQKGKDELQEVDTKGTVSWESGEELLLCGGTTEKAERVSMDPPSAALATRI